MNDIYILDLDTMTYKLSKVECPTNSEFHAVYPNNINYDSIVNGFIRSNFHTFLPNDIIELIKKWCQYKYVHLFDRRGKGNHWKIDINNILS